jgi:hypothetical protein
MRERKLVLSVSKVIRIDKDRAIRAEEDATTQWAMVSVGRSQTNDQPRLVGVVNKWMGGLVNESMNGVDRQLA